MLHFRNKLIIVFVFLCSMMQGHGQDNVTKIMGTVINDKSKQPIPFVNVYFKESSIQSSTDFDGRFSLETKTPSDTLVAQYMGYKTMKKAIIKNKFQYVDFELEPLSYELPEVVILPGVNPAEVLLKKVIRNKPQNNMDEYDAYEYEAYTVIQVDANNFKEKLKNRALIRPFKFVFDNVDTSVINGKAYLPVFVSESLSDIYFRKEPKTRREIIKASKISGMENESIAKLLGTTYMQTNLYHEYLDFFEKNFASPIANFGLAYYKYYLSDSGFIDGRWCYKLSFKPRRVQELTFSGTMWITDTTYALKEVDMRMVGDANINLLNEIVIRQKFDKVDSVHYMPVEDKLIADVNLTEANLVLGCYITRNSSFKNILVDKVRDSKAYEIPEDITILDSATKKSSAFWAGARHDSLTREMKNIYHLVDTVQTLPAFKLYKGLAILFISGHVPWGGIEFGPWLSTYSFNKTEGSRFRFGFRSNNNFSTNMQFDAYLAYGTSDKVFKYGGDIWYRFSSNPNSGFGFTYKYDIEQLGEGQKAFKTDNLIGSFMRRNPRDKLSMVEETRGYYEHDWFMGLTTRLFVVHRVIWPMGSTEFEFKHNGRSITKPDITTSEIKLNLHFAFNEKFISGALHRWSLGTEFPTLEIYYTYGAKGLWKSDYSYHKLQLNLEQRFPVGMLGWSKYFIEAGKIWGRLPYSLLKIHEANETLWFDQRTANLMNYYEFISDEYLSIFYTHHFDGLMLNKIPLLRKLHWRELIHARCIMGKISDENRSYNVFPEKTFFLTKPYFEVGAGIENILTVIRVDVLYRLSYLDHPDVTRLQGFVSFHFNF